MKIPFALTAFALLFAAPSFAAEIAGCKDADYVTLTGPAVTIKAGRGSYSPKCARVAPGTQVTIEASTFHPLQAMADIEGVPNPFRTAGRGATSALSQSLPQAGTYGYFCENHGDIDGSGMAGSIRVE